MARALKVKLFINEKSYWFPVWANWKIGSVSYSDAFETWEQAKGYFIGRYGNVEFIYK